MDEAPSHPPPVTPNRAVLITVAALGCGVGLLPYLLFVDRLAYLWAVVPGMAVVTFFALRDFKTEATAHPALGEWLLGAWSVVARPSIGSLMGLMFFGLFYGGQNVFVGAARYFGFAPGGDPSAWGYWGSVWFVGILTIAAGTRGAQGLARQLYPREAWARSAFVPLLARPKLIALGASGAVAVLAAMLWLLDLRGVALPVLLTLLFFYTSFPLADLGKEPADQARAEVVDLLASVLQEAGYHIVRMPRTGKAEIDPLLQSVDLLAKSNDRAFAVEVKSVASRAPVEWNEASAVRTAAVVLSDEIVADSGPPLPVEPVLLLVGGTIAQSLEAFSQRERVPIVHFKDVGDVIGNRRELADRLQAAGLAFPSPQPALSATS